MNLRSTLLRLAGPSLLILSFAACDDDVSPIGGSIVNNEVSINVDSSLFKLPARTVYSDAVDARSATTLLGNISAPEYGSLSANYVTQLLAASSLTIPDSIGVDRVDSTKLVLTIPRDKIYGDSLAPQQLTVYRLTGSLPTNLSSNFNPEGYYDPSKAVNYKNYVLSAINLSDSILKKSKNLNLAINLPTEWGRDAFNAYRNNPDVFQWPATFCKEFPGFFLKSSFGRGALANVTMSKVMLYYHFFVERNVVENDTAVKRTVQLKDSVAIFGSGPEVLSSSLFKYEPSANLKSLAESGRVILTAPLGYHAEITFPAKELLNMYWTADHNLSVINNLTLTIPASSVPNSLGITPPPELLMIKKAEIESFFAEGKIPDDKSSFRGTYNSANGRYEFSSMRKYIVDLIDEKDIITADDLEFALIPVKITTESIKNSDDTVTVYVTGCSLYLDKPAMAELFTDRAAIVFTYTRQLIK